MNAGDSWRLSIVTLTVLPTRPPRHVDREVAKVAMLVAPVAALPLGCAVGLILIVGHLVRLPDLVTALLAVGAIALGTRCLHLDGLSDTIDGLAASFDRDRSLEVMKGGTAGPAGVVGLIIVIGIQAGALASLVSTAGGALLAGIAVAASRAALAVCCARGIASARPDGLGGIYAGSVPRGGAVLVWLLVAVALVTAACFARIPLWRPVVAVCCALALLILLLRHVSRRLGGVTGDVFGAAVEMTFATFVAALA